MNGDEIKSKTQPTVPATPSIKREAETTGLIGVQNEIVKDQEVKDYVVENPNPEALSPVEISQTQVHIPSQPTVSSIAKSPIEEISTPISKIPTPSDALQVVKGENILTSPDGTIGVSTVVVHQDRRSSYRKGKGLDALPKAA